jgi:tRNA (guanine37-N1)-methyltransferase
MQFDIISVIPSAFGYLDQSILGRAQKQKKIKVKVHDLRKWTTDKHRTVDDRPYSGGPGMVLKVEPLHKAIKAVRKKRGKVKVILMSAKGKPFTQAIARQWIKLNQIVFIAGRYEGVDERIMKDVDEEISTGEYVLTGGELPAMAIIDAVARLLPGVLGKDESSVDESHSQKGILEYPQYTRPEVFKRRRVPKELLSGSHRIISEWRKVHTKKR